MRPPTILHVIDSLQTGGAEQQLARHLQYADFGRFHHLVCSLTGSARFAEVLRGIGVGVHSLALAPRRDMLRGAQRLRRMVREHKPALIHATLFRAAVISRTVGQLTGVPVVTSLVSPTYEPEWSTDNPFLQGSHVRFAYAIDRFTARAWGTWFVAISEAVKTSAVRQFGILPDKITVIPRGVAFDRAPSVSDAEVQEARAFLDEQTYSPVILSVGRLVPPKGQRYAVAAMPRVLATHPSARLVFAGEGWLRSELETQVRELGLDGHVLLAGERRDVDRLLRAADMFVFPSLSEGFGVALLEAMAAGCPCVASRIPAVEEITDGGRVVVLSAPRSPDSIAEGILRLAGDPGLAARLGSAAAAWAREQYDVAASMRQMETLYSALVSGPRSQRQEARVGIR